MSRFPTWFSAQFPLLPPYLIIIALKSDIRVSWSLVVCTPLSHRDWWIWFPRVASDNGLFPDFHFQYGVWCTVIWGFLCEELSQIGFWRRVMPVMAGNGIILCSAWQRHYARGSYAKRRWILYGEVRVCICLPSFFLSGVLSILGVPYKLLKKKVLSLLKAARRRLF